MSDEDEELEEELKEALKNKEGSKGIERAGKNIKVSSKNGKKEKEK